MKTIIGWFKNQKIGIRFKSSIPYIGLMFYVFPFWSFILAILLSIQDSLNKKHKDLSSVVEASSALIITCVWIGIILFVFAILSNKILPTNEDVSPFLKSISKFGIFIGLGILITIVVLYGYLNNWNSSLLTNLTILYLLALSFFTSKGIVKLYEWVFKGSTVDEKIKLKLSFINKLLVGGFGLIATILGIALTIKNLFS